MCVHGAWLVIVVLLLCNLSVGESPATLKENNPTLFRIQASGKYGFERLRDFRIVRHESGKTNPRIPIFTSPMGTIKLGKEDQNFTASHQEPVAGVPSALLIHNVMTPEECDQIIALSEAMGHTEDAPVSLGRDIRHMDNCVWIADRELNEQLFSRLKHLLPQSIDGWTIAGLNARWRLYKYNPFDVFRPHTDGAWGGYEINKQGMLVDAFPGQLSKLTFVLYLNDDFDGGTTRLYPSGHTQSGVDVVPRRGSVLSHPGGILHQGSEVLKGTKYIIRSDVLFEPPRHGRREL